MVRYPAQPRKDFIYKHKIFASLAKGKVLDMGCGSDPNPFLKKAVGLDIQRIPKPSNYSRVIVCNLNTERIPVKDKSFNTVIMGDLIEHLENPTAALLEAHRVLKDNGLLLVSTPNAAYYWNLVDDWLFLHLFKDNDPGEHLNDWTRRDFTRLLNKNGFHLEKMRGAGGKLPLLRLRYPNKHFPVLGWIVIYVARKVKPPVRDVLVTRGDSTRTRLQLKQ